MEWPASTTGTQLMCGPAQPATMEAVTLSACAPPDKHEGLGGCACRLTQPAGKLL